MNKFQCTLLTETRNQFKRSLTPLSPALDILSKNLDSDDDEEIAIEGDVLNFQIINQISNSKLPIFMVWSDEKKKYFAVKAFKFYEEHIDSLYKNESRFSSLSHPNIISIVETHDKKRALLNQEDSLFSSFIVMELARCDFRSILERSSFYKNEKLVRTYFHQLVEGLEYLHSQGVAHADLKPDNILIGEDYKLRITDFDLSYRMGDTGMIGKGTRNFRAPEVASEDCINPMLADIYSLGVILFCFMTSCVPYNESQLTDGKDLYNVLINNPSSYWSTVESSSKTLNRLDRDFRELFMSLVQKDPMDRATIADIKKSNWYKKPVYSNQEAASWMQNIVKLIIE